ncbi:MAG: lysoplasmalogenase [Thermodesulfobacteriota bacterium]|nr:lysoplasmalogenase [Thermodesulfobacteriota bacterium]
MINVFIIIGACLLLVGLLYHEKKKKKKSCLINKTILSTLFVVIALLQPHPVQTYFYYLLSGLVLCLIGDVCLALPGEKTFKMGLVAFLLGHVFYIFGFAVLTGLPQWISPGALVILGISLFIFIWLRPYLKSMLLPVMVYMLVITAMVFGAWAVFWKSAVPFTGRALILAGALSFYFSDIFVARDRFIKEEYTNRLLGLPLYYLGQFSLAFSVGLLQ